MIYIQRGNRGSKKICEVFFVVRAALKECQRFAIQTN